MNKAIAIAALEHKLRGPLSRMLPHETYIKVYSRARSWYLDLLSSANPNITPPQYRVRAFGLTFRNDLGNAAGFDKDGKLLSFSYLAGAGFGVVGTILNDFNSGNLISAFGKQVNPWVPLHYSESAINTLGLPSYGIEPVARIVDSFRQRFQPRDFPIFISLMEHPSKEQTEGEKLSGLLECFRKALTTADGIEINASCPNVGHSEEEDKLVKKLSSIIALRNEFKANTGRYIPVLVKVRDFGESSYTIKVMSQIGIDGIVGVNSQTNYKELRDNVQPLDLLLYDYYTTKYKGGVTGAIIRNFARRQIETAVKQIKQQKSPLKLVEVGGIGSFEDVKKSRSQDESVPLRQWYTRMFKAFSTQPIEKVYDKMVLG